MSLLSIANFSRAWFDKVIMAMAIIAGVLFLVCAIYIVVDISSRAVFGTAPLGGREVSTYVLAMGVSWSVACTFRRRGHIRIDVVFFMLPARLQIILDVVATAMMGLFSLALSYYSWDLTITSFLQNIKSVTSLQTPLFIPQAMMALGFTTLTIEVLVFLLLQMAQIISGKSADQAVVTRGVIGSE